MSVKDSINSYFKEWRSDVRRSLRSSPDLPSEQDIVSFIACGYARDIESLHQAIQEVETDGEATGKLFWIVVELAPSSAGDLLGDAAYKVSY